MANDFNLKPEFKITQQTGNFAQVLFKNVRLSFVRIRTPHKFENGEKYYFSTCCLIPKRHAKPIVDAVFALAESLADSCTQVAKKDKEECKETAKQGKRGSIFRNGNTFTDKEGNVYEAFEDSVVIQPSTQAELVNGIWQAKQQLRIQQVNRVIPREEYDNIVYSGCYADVGVTLKPYAPVGSTPSGVAKYLAGIRVVHPGQRLGIRDPFADDVREDVSDDWWNDGSEPAFAGSPGKTPNGDPESDGLY